MTDRPAGDTLPIVDLENRDEQAAERVAAALDRAFRDTGFCYVTRTGVPPDTVAAVFDASRRFHALDGDAKSAIAINSTHRGYIAPKSSLIRTSSVARVTRPNLSESFMAMHEVDPADPRYGREVHGPNQWPDLPGFRDAVHHYDQALTGLARHLTRLIALALGIDAVELARLFERPTTWLRLLHYPALPEDAPAEQYGSAPHTDYGFITVLAQDSEGGLEVRRRDGEWIRGTPLPDSFIVNVADMLERISAGRWRSTPHRVRSHTDRYSVPFFFDMDMDAVVEPMVRGDDAERSFEPVRFGDYVMARLTRNYAYRADAPTP